MAVGSCLVAHRDFFSLAIECERLEAESLRTVTSTRRQQSAPATSNTPGVQKKRTRRGSADGSTIEVIDLREESPEPTRPRKRAKDRKEAGRLVPYFEQDWVQDLLANSNSVRAFSPLAADHVTDPHAQDRLQNRSIAQQTTPTFNGATTHLAILNKNAFQGEPAESRATTSADDNCSSDDDVPLASTSKAALASLCSVDESAPMLTAIDKIGAAVKELREAYELEMQRFQAKFAEHAVLIDCIRAHVKRTMSSRKTAPQGIASNGPVP